MSYSCYASGHAYHHPTGLKGGEKIRLPIVERQPRELKMSVQRVAQLLAGLELRQLRCRDLDRLACPRISALEALR